MLASLFVAFIVAGLVAAATAGVIVVQKREAIESKVAIERLKRENLDLQVRIAPRRLSAEQQAALAKALAPFKGTKVRLESYVLDPEGEVLASQIRDALRDTFKFDDWIGAEEPENGFTKGINVRGRSDLVAALMGAFKAAGLTGIVNEQPPRPQVIKIVTEASRDKAKDVVAVVTVGVKPTTQ